MKLYYFDVVDDEANYVTTITIKSDNYDQAYIKAATQAQEVYGPVADQLVSMGSAPAELHEVTGALWSTPEGPDDGGACILKADRNEDKTAPTERDRNIKHAAQAWNMHEELVQALLDASFALNMCPRYAFRGAHSHPRYKSSYDVAARLDELKRKLGLMARYELDENNQWKLVRPE